MLGSHRVKVMASPASTPTSTASLSTMHCDAVVVGGSGSGGAVVAGMLAKAGYHVLAIDKRHYFSFPALSLLKGPSTEQMYESGGLIAATDDVGALLRVGATVGGGSPVNGSACIRTPNHMLNEWCDRYELKLGGQAIFLEALDCVCTPAWASE